MMRYLPSPPEKNKVVLIAGVVFLVLFALGAIYGDRGFIDLQRLRAEQQQLEQVAFHQQLANAQLREHLRRLRSDDQYLERWAREHLHWVRPGEIVYRFNDPSNTHGLQ